MTFHNAQLRNTGAIAFEMLPSMLHAPPLLESTQAQAGPHAHVGSTIAIVVGAGAVSRPQREPGQMALVVSSRAASFADERSASRGRVCQETIR